MKIFNTIKLWIKEEYSQDIIFVVVIATIFFTYCAWYTYSMDRYQYKEYSFLVSQNKDSNDQ